MSKKPNVWITPRPDGDWNIRREGNKNPTRVVTTKKEAEEIGREIAKKDGVNRISQGKDGKIISHDSFGNDPCPPKDTEH